MKHHVRLLRVVLFATLLMATWGGTLVPNVVFAENFHDYSEKLVTLDEVNALQHPWAGGWVSTNPAEASFDDGLCRSFQLEAAPQFILDNCIFDRSEEYNVSLLRDYYAQASAIDLTEKSAYTYDVDDYFIYGYHESNNNLPKYLLFVEQDGFLLGASITTQNFKLGEEPFSAFSANEEFALDDLLQAVMTINLGKIGALPATVDDSSGDVASQNMIQYDDELEAGAENLFMFMAFPGDQLRVGVEPNSALDISLEIQDINQNALLEVNDGGVGAIERLEYTIPQDSENTIFRVLLRNEAGSGSFESLIDGSSGVTFNLIPEFLVGANLEAGGSLFYTYTGNTGDVLLMLAQPHPDDPIDLHIRIYNLKNVDEMLAEFNETGPGEQEQVAFTLPEESTYILMIDEVNDAPGRYMLAARTK
jgi:hypothetical protein